MSHSKFFAGILVTVCLAMSCNNSETKKEDQTAAAATSAPSLKEETVTIQADSASMIS